MSSALTHIRDIQDALTRLEADAGSAAQAEHLTAELVGRYDGDRRPLAAIAIGAEYAGITAILNDYGIEDAFVRPVRAHGRLGDVLVALSTSGRSPNVLAAVRMAHDIGMASLALTGPAPNPLASLCNDAIVVDAARTATVQEAHQVVIHLLCAGIDHVVRSRDHIAPAS